MMGKTYLNVKQLKWLIVMCLINPCNKNTDITQWAGVAYHKRSWLSTALCSESEGLIGVDPDRAQSIQCGKWILCTLGRTFNSTTTCLTRFWMHLGIRIRHIPKKVGKNIVFQCHETIEAAEILCYKFIKGQIELSLFWENSHFHWLNVSVGV